MIYDAKLELSNEQAITDSAASTNLIDCQATNPDVGEGTPVELLCTVQTSFEGDGTMTISLQDSANGTDFADIARSLVLDVNVDCLVGDEFRIPVPKTTRRYLRGYYTKVSGTISAGKIHASLVVNQ